MTSISNTQPHASCPTSFNMTEYVLAAGKKTPDKIALKTVSLSRSDEWSYDRLRRSILSTAQLLLDAGLVAGDTVLIRLGNVVEFPIYYLAAIAVGIIPIPTSAQLTSNEVDVIVRQMHPNAMIWDGTTPPPSKPLAVTVRIEDIKENYTGTQASPIEGDPDRLAYVVYTSGTGGTPRAVGHAHRAVWARRMMWRDWYDLQSDDVLLHAGAFNWTYTMGTGLMDPWAIGATALIPCAETPLEDLPDLLKQHGATIFAAAPGVYRRILRRTSEWSTPTLRHGLSAGEKMPQSLRDQWTQTTNTPVCEAYGMSECSTFISSSPRNPDVFKPQAGRRVAILGPNGTSEPFDTAGMIAISTDDQGFMLGYQHAQEETNARIRNGWFLTGDQGQMNTDGHVTYLGRADDMLNAGGYRVSPLEIEATMSLLASTGECAAVSVEIKPDVFVIALFFTGTADQNVLRTHAQAHLAKYKCPRLYIARDVLPKGANNKLLRKVLRDSFSETDNG